MMPTLPPSILAHLHPFRTIFVTKKTYLKASLLLIGVLLCQGSRTICSVLRVLGLKGEKTFAKYHHVLNRAKLKTLEGSKILLQKIDLDQDEPLTLVIDSHLERRKGSRIWAKGHYRDAVQSGNKYTVISSGLKWLSVMALKKISWSKRTFALPFLTVLMPHEESNKSKRKQHKTMHDWTCQIIMQIRRWLPKRKIILTADSEFASAAIAISCVKQSIAFISRLKLNARLFDFPIQSHKGRPRKKGLRLPGVGAMLNNPEIQWMTIEINWYGGKVKEVQCMTGTCLWHVMTHSATPITIRYVLIKDPEGKFKPVLLMSTDIELGVKQIIETYVKRWNIEVTFHETREHLGIETQRQWSDKAIARTTPILFALYSIVVLIGRELIKEDYIKIDKTAWYQKDEIKFSDIIKGIKKYILEKMYFCNQGFLSETEEKGTYSLFDRVIALFLNAA